MIQIIKQIAPKEGHYHIAVSMGTDSVAALLWMRNKGYNLTPLHFNHGLRPQNDLMEEKFHELCRALNLKGQSEKGQNLTTEGECRDARLNFYSKVASKIVTAHHLNDWVESYLLNCFRGHPNHTPFELESHFPNFSVIHPFLLTKKEDFSEYLRRNGWDHYVVQDESNEIVKGSRRNWVRRAIIPQMESQKLSLEKYAKRKIKETNRSKV